MTAPLPSAFVWTRFGTEAGETIDSILQRKEQERVSNCGVFWWGIGNSVGRAVSLLAKEIDSPVAIFSSISGRPRAIDAAPTCKAKWTAAEDWLGFSVPIPEHTLVTSHGGRAVHYALVCRAETPLTFAAAEHIFAGDLTNFESGRPVGASQTTAVVRNNFRGIGKPYAVALRVRLVEPYVVTLRQSEPFV